MKILINAASLLLSVMLIAPEDAMATVTMTQSNSEVIVGGTTHISCVTSLPKEIYWRYFPAGGPAHEQKDVYAYGKMHSPYKDRCEMHINRTTGFYQLVFPRVELTDAGVYTCQEDDGIGDSAQAQLTVLDAGPTCTSNKNPIELIGPNSCNKVQENLTLACSVAYRGNIQPVLEWKMVGANGTVTQGLHVEKAENRITYHLTMSSQPYLHGSSFICQTTKTPYNCTSDVINIIYVISSNFTQKATIGDTIVCTANTNESCSYRWKWFKGDDVLTASNNQILIPKQSGNFRCEAECIIRKEPCTITAMYAYVEDGNVTSTIGDKELGPGYAALIAVAVLLTVGAIIIVLLYLFRKRYLKKSRGAQSQEPEQQPINGHPPEAMGLLSFRNEGNKSDEVDADDVIQKAFNANAYIGKGISGGVIHGPGQYEGKQCACEKIMCFTDQQTPAKEGEMTKEEKIRPKGQQWMELDHGNLIKFYDVVLKPKAAFIIMEYTAGGSLRNALKKCTESDVNLEMPVVKDWATQIVKGMNYLHDNGIVHKSLNSVRILIVESFEASDILNKTLKISQFRLIDDNPMSTDGEEKFSFSAPEAFSGIYEKEGDVWSFGIVMWEMLTKKQPYKDEMRIEKIMEDSRGGAAKLEIPHSCPEELKGILIECRSVTSSGRPPFSEILRRLQEWKAVTQKEY